MGRLLIQPNLNGVTFAKSGLTYNKNYRGVIVRHEVILFGFLPLGFVVASFLFKYYW